MQARVIHRCEHLCLVSQPGLSKEWAASLTGWLSPLQPGESLPAHRCGLRSVLKQKQQVNELKASSNLLFLSASFFFLFFLQYWGLNYSTSPFFCMLDIFEIGYCKLFAKAGF
jgi:hypothetical protein